MVCNSVGNFMTQSGEIGVRRHNLSAVNLRNYVFKFIMRTAKKSIAKNVPLRKNQYARLIGLCDHGCIARRSESFHSDWVNLSGPWMIGLFSNDRLIF